MCIIVYVYVYFVTYGYFMFFICSFFLQYFDTVGLVFWPVKIVSCMTYIVLAGRKSLLNQPSFAIFDIRALWRSALSIIVPGCQKLQMMAKGLINKYSMYFCISFVC